MISLTGLYVWCSIFTLLSLFCVDSWMHCMECIEAETVLLKNESRIILYLVFFFFQNSIDRLTLKQLTTFEMAKSEKKMEKKNWTIFNVISDNKCFECFCFCHQSKTVLLNEKLCFLSTGNFSFPSLSNLSFAFDDCSAFLFCRFFHILLFSND